MKYSFRLLSLLLLIIGVSSAGLAWAEKADSEKPTNIEADRMVYDDTKQVNTFSGNVILSRGTLQMKGGKLTLTRDASGNQHGVLQGPPGGLATFRQKRDGGPNLWIEGQAERIEYDGKTEVVKLFTRARIRRLEGTKITDEVEGDFITYDSRSEFFTVNNAEPGQAKSGSGRVKVVIQPSAESKGK